MPPTQRRTGGVAFLLAQLGHHAAERFAERISTLDVTPPQAGILRALATEPGRSQQALAEQLGLFPSRVVTFIDDLEQRGYLERRRNTNDRRLYALYLTDAGEQLMGRLAEIGKAHEDDITAGLTQQQRSQFRSLLTTLAERQGLTPGVHPGYRTLGRGVRPCHESD